MGVVVGIPVAIDVLCGLLCYCCCGCCTTSRVLDFFCAPCNLCPQDAKKTNHCCSCDPYKAFDAQPRIYESPCDVFGLYIKRMSCSSIWISIYMFISLLPLLSLQVNQNNTTTFSPTTTSSPSDEAFIGYFLLYYLESTLGVLVAIWFIALQTRIFIKFLTLYMKMICNLSFKEADTYGPLSIVHTIYAVTFIVWLKFLINDVDSDPYDAHNVTQKYVNYLTNDKYVEFWIFSVSLSPIFVLLVVISRLKIIQLLYDKENKQKLLLQVEERVDVEEQKDSREENAASKNKPGIIANMISINVILILHFILLCLWIFWQLFTFENLTVSGYNNYTYRSNKNDFDPLVSFGILWTATTLIKYVCKLFIFLYLKSAANSRNKQRRLNMGVRLFITMLYNLGMKFVFANIETWNKFIIVSITSCIGNITFYAAFLSNTCAKTVIIELKKVININFHDIRDFKYWNNYNKTLAINLGISFTISMYSYCIIIIYLLMFSWILNSTVKYEVYQFLGLDCLFTVIVFMGELFFFKKEHVKYFGYVWELSLNKKEDHDHALILAVENTRIHFDMGGIIFYQMLLSWIWMGNLTGIPAEFSGQ